MCYLKVLEICNFGLETTISQQNQIERNGNIFIKNHLKDGVLTDIEYQKLRYIISFARLTVIEDDYSNTYNVNEWITSHRDWILEHFKSLFNTTFFQKKCPMETDPRSIESLTK